MKISFRPLAKESTESFLKLYNESFPEDERRLYGSVSEFERFVEEREGKFSVMEILSDGSFAGFISYWIFDDYVYGEHFAVDPSLRGSGIGAETFKGLIDIACKAGKPLILEVELPDNDLARRRIGFYERLGCRLRSEVEYIQPAYRPTASPLPMHLMTWGELDLARPGILDSIRREVYGVK